VPNDNLFLEASTPTIRWFERQCNIGATCSHLVPGVSEIPELWFGNGFVRGETQPVAITCVRWPTADRCYIIGLHEGEDWAVNAEFWRRVDRICEEEGLTWPDLVSLAQVWTLVLQPKREIRLPRRYAGAPFWLAPKARDHLAALKDIRQWFEIHGPQVMSTVVALCSLTSEDDPAGWQMATPKELLDVLHPLDGQDGRHGGALHERLLWSLNVLDSFKVPFHRWLGIDPRTGRKVGSVTLARLVQGLSLIYRDNQTGEDVEPTDRPDDETPFKLEGFVEYAEKHQSLLPNGTNPRSEDIYLKGLPGERYSLLGYGWRWGTDIAEDLLMEPILDDRGRPRRDSNGRILYKGSGYLRLQRDLVSPTLKALRSHKTAMRLLLLLVADLDQHLGKSGAQEKSAKKVFLWLGFADPGDTRKGHLHKKDGDWARNCKQVSRAVRALKAQDVLTPDSDEAPRSDLNPDRRKGPYYQWKLTEPWRPPNRDQLEIPSGSVPIDNRWYQTSMLQDLDGDKIRRARKAARLTLRQFAERFGPERGGCSHNQWARIERGEIHRRSGQKIGVPGAIEAEIRAFVREHCPEIL